MQSRDSGYCVGVNNSPESLSHPGFTVCLSTCTLSNSEETFPARGTSQHQLCRFLSDPDVWTPPWLSGSQLVVELLKNSSGIHAFNYHLSSHPSVKNNEATVVSVSTLAVWMKGIGDTLSCFRHVPIYVKLFQTLKCNKNRNWKVS